MPDRFTAAGVPQLLHEELDNPGCVDLVNDLALAHPGWSTVAGHVALARIYDVCVSESREYVPVGTTAQVIEAEVRVRKPWWGGPRALWLAAAGLVGVGLVVRGVRR